MFDFRYHVASLVAVFLALVIGILVGVGIADRGVREDALRRDLANARSQLDQAQGKSAFLVRQQKATQDFVDSSYPALMAHRLDGKRIALVFVGSVDDDVRSSVQKAVGDAGGKVAFMRALKLPVDRKTMQSALARRRQLIASYAGDDGLGKLGQGLAQELVSGGDTPLWNAVGTKLIEEQTGKYGKADGVVVTRTVGPQQRPDRPLPERPLRRSRRRRASRPWASRARTRRRPPSPSCATPASRRSTTSSSRPAASRSRCSSRAGRAGATASATEDDALMPPIDPGWLTPSSSPRATRRSASARRSPRCASSFRKRRSSSPTTARAMRPRRARRRRGRGSCACRGAARARRSPRPSARRRRGGCSLPTPT